MKTLIMKERKIIFYINLLNIAVIFLLSIPYAILYRVQGNFDIGLILIIWASTYSYIESSLNQGNISNDDILLASMPIERDLIVKSKYVSVFLMILRSFVIFVAVVLLSMNTLYSGSSLFEIINMGKILVTVSIIIIFLSISLLAYYSKKGVNKEKDTSLFTLINTLPFIFLMLAIWKSREDGDIANILSKFNDPILVILIFIGGILLYFMSYLISVKKYRNTEF